MVNINIYYDEGGILKEMIIEGHAGIKNDDGYEVCIAISSISQAMIIAIENAIGIGSFRVKRKSGYMKFVCKTDRLNNYDKYIYAIISNAFVDSIKAFAKQYKKYIVCVYYN